MGQFLLPKETSFSKDAKTPALIMVSQLQDCSESGRLLWALLLKSRWYNFRLLYI